jgi:hypothetical protein
LNPARIAYRAGFCALRQASAAERHYCAGAPLVLIVARG